MAALCNEANAEKVTICHQEQQAVISGLTVGKCHMTQLWLHSSGREKVISKSWKQLQLQDEIHFVFCNTLNQTFSVGECNYVQLLFNSSGLLSPSKVKRIVHSVVIFQMEEWCRWIQVRLSCCLVPRLQWADDNERGGIQGMWQGVCTDERFLQFTSFSLWEWRNKMIRQSLIIIRELLILTLSIFITLLGCISWYHWQQGWYQIILSTGTILSNTQYTP